VGESGSDQSESNSSCLEALDNPHNGLNVVDFAPPSLIWSIKKAICLLTPIKRRLLLFAVGIQISLGVLDLIGILLVGLLAAVAVSGIGVSQLPQWLTTLIDNLGLGGLTVSQLSVGIALSAVFILILKSFLSALMTRRITRFLANRQEDLSVALARDF
jgi:hypothetical protein